MWVDDLRERMRVRQLFQNRNYYGLTMENEKKIDIYIKN